MREGLWAPPSVLHAVNQDINLFVRQSPAKALGEGRHGGAWYALGDNLPQGIAVHQRQIEWITQGARRS